MIESPGAQIASAKGNTTAMLGATEGDEVVAGLEEDFDSFYRREFRSAVGVAAALCGNLAAGEDIAQEAFVAAHRRWSEIGTYDSPGAWVRRVVANRSVSRTRRLFAETKALARFSRLRRDDESDVPDATAPVWDSVRQLPRQQRQAIVLVYLDQRTVAETAQILECSVNTIKTHLARAKRSLASKLGEEQEE